MEENDDSSKNEVDELRKKIHDLENKVETKNVEDSWKQEKYKSMGVTVLLSLLVGIVLLGIGHFYVKKKKSGIVWLVGGLAVAIIGLMVPSVYAQNENLQEFYLPGIEVNDFEIIDGMNKIYFISSQGDIDDENTKRGLYVLNKNLEKIEFIPIPQSNIFDIAINEKSNKAYIPLINSKQQIAIIDITKDEILPPIELQSSELSDEPPLHEIGLGNLVIDEQSNTLFVSYSMQLGKPLRDAGGIVAIDENTKDIIGKLFFEDFTPGKITIDKNSKKLFLTGNNDYNALILKIDYQRMIVVDQLEMEPMWIGEMRFLKNGLFVTASDLDPFGNEINGKVLMIEPSTMKITKSNDSLNSPWGIDIDFNGNRVFVSAHTSVKTLDLDSFLIIDDMEVPTWQSPVRYDGTNDVLFIGGSNYYGKITLDKTEIISEEPIKKRYSNFPSYDKSPNYYLDRFYNEAEYRDWFETNFPNSSIEEIVKYQTTHIENFPDNSKTPKSYIQIYYDEKEYQEWFNSQFPNSSIQNMLGLTYSDVSNILTELAKEHNENSEFEKALDKLKIATRLLPQNSDAHIERGTVYEKMSEYDKAIQSFEQALLIEPEGFDAIVGLAYNYHAKNIFDKSKEYYERALKIVPMDASAISNYGVLLSDIGDVKGLEYTQRAKDLENDNVDWVFNHALALDFLGMYDEAIQEYNLVLQLEPKDTDVMNNIAAIYGYRGELDNAEKYLQMAIETDSEDKITKNNIDLLYEERIDEIEDIHLPKLLELNYKIQINIANGNERNAREYARELITLYETKIEPFMPDTKQKTDIAENIDQVKRELKIDEYAQSGGGCLIATAAYGSEMAPQVQFLREIRDNTIMSTESGTTFMTGFNQFYYSFSPYVANYERENPFFKEMVKVTLTPLLTSLTLLNYVEIDTEEEMLGYGIGIILLNVGMYFVAPAVLIMSLKKRLDSFRDQ